MDFIFGNMHKIIIGGVMFFFSWIANILNNYYDWFDPSTDIVLTLLGLASGCFTIRWLIVKTRTIKELSQLEIEEKKLEITLREMEIEQSKPKSKKK